MDNFSILFFTISWNSQGFHDLSHKLFRCEIPINAIIRFILHTIIILVTPPSWQQLGRLIFWVFIWKKEQNTIKAAVTNYINNDPDVDENNDGDDNEHDEHLLAGP